MWYYPIHLKHEIVRLNRLAHGLLGHGYHHHHHHQHHGFRHPAMSACCAPSTGEVRQLTEGEGTAKEQGQEGSQRNYLRPYIHASLDEENDSITLRADMPGVEKKDLELEATASKITFKAESKARAYKAIVPLRHKIDPKSAKASLKAGVLELELKLAKPLKEKATKIKVD